MARSTLKRTVIDPAGITLRGWLRPRRPRPADLAIWLPTLAVSAWAAIRALGLEGGTRPVQLMTFTPYVALGSIVPLAVALSRRRWIAAGLTAAATITLAGCVVPRGISTTYPDGLGAAGRPTIRVMTSNVLTGIAKADDLVRLVRERRIDVLAVQELTAEMEHDLDEAGIAALLPHRATNPQPGASGTGLFTRFSIGESSARQLVASGFVQTSATVSIPGVGAVEIESAHPCAPYMAGYGSVWRSDLAQQPIATPRGTLRILLGDFNSTLDHHRFRKLIATGYRDAAAVTGQGFIPTWPNDGQLIPGITLDHVLADRRIGIRRVSIEDVRGSDHRAVLAELALPQDPRH